ncbi:MAG: hypothetical protein AAF764_07585 [Pseudomonadota bacterium]
MSNDLQNFSAMCAAIAASGEATAEDVQHLRGIAMADGRLCRNEVEAAFAVDKVLQQRSDEWVWWLREITADHLFGVFADQKHLSQTGADWLLHIAQPLGVVESRARLEVVVRVVEVACSMPEPFYQTVLLALADAVVANQRDGQSIICAEDAAQLRRVLYASAGDGRFAISRAEAEFLFDLNDRTSEAGNAPEWTELFVQAISNYLMASFGHQCPHRHTALEQPVETSDNSGFWSRVVEGLSGVLQSPADKIDEHFAKTNATFADDAEEAVMITPHEADWVLERIARSGGTDATEQELLTRLRLQSAA